MNTRGDSGGHDGDAALTALEFVQIMAIAAFCSLFGLGCAIGAYA